MSISPLVTKLYSTGTSEFDESFIFRDLSSACPIIGNQETFSGGNKRENEVKEKGMEGRKEGKKGREQGREGDDKHLSGFKSFLCLVLFERQTFGRICFPSDSYNFLRVSTVSQIVETFARLDS